MSIEGKGLSYGLCCLYGLSYQIISERQHQATTNNPSLAVQIAVREQPLFLATSDPSKRS